MANRPNAELIMMWVNRSRWFFAWSCSRRGGGGSVHVSDCTGVGDSNGGGGVGDADSNGDDVDSAWNDGDTEAAIGIAAPAAGAVIAMIMVMNAAAMDESTTDTGDAGDTFIPIFSARGPRSRSTYCSVMIISCVVISILYTRGLAGWIY